MNIFPRPQRPSSPVNDVIGAMRGDRRALLALMARRSPQLAQMMGGMSDDQVMQYGNQLMQSNPQFADFVNSHRGMSVAEIAREYGINL